MTTRSTVRGTGRFAVALAKTSLAAAMAQRGAFAMQAGLMALNNAIFFTFWIVLLHRVQSIRGYGLREMTVLYGMVACGVGLAMIAAGGVRDLARVIHEGELDAFLAQPKPILLFVLGRRSGASGVGDLVSGVALIALSGAVRPTTAPIVVLAAIASAVVMVSSGVLFGSLAFWLGPIDAASRQLFELVITFSVYPEPLFGGVLRVVLFTLVPAGFVGYVPSRVVETPTFGAAAVLVAAAAAYAALATWTFARGLRTYCGGTRLGAAG